jgi:hypothetical protein
MARMGVGCTCDALNAHVHVGRVVAWSRQMSAGSSTQYNAPQKHQYTSFFHEIDLEHMFYHCRVGAWCSGLVGTRLRAQKTKGWWVLMAKLENELRIELCSQQNAKTKPVPSVNLIIFNTESKAGAKTEKFFYYFLFIVHAFVRVVGARRVGTRRTCCSSQRHSTSSKPISKIPFGKCSERGRAKRYAAVQLCVQLNGRRKQKSWPADPGCRRAGAANKHNV